MNKNLPAVRVRNLVTKERASIELPDFKPIPPKDIDTHKNAC